MRLWRRYALLLGGAYLVFMIASLPATAVYSRLAPQLAPLSLEGIRGSVWSGSAQRLHHPAWQVEQVSWTLLPLPLLLGRLEANWHIDDAQVRGRGRAGRRLGGTLYLDDTTLALPVSTLQALGIVKTGLHLNGNLKVELRALQSEAGRIIAADGLVDATGLGLETPPLAFGDFELKIETVDTGIQALLNDRGGPLSASGSATLTPDGQYRFTARIAARDGRDSQLANYLALTGRPGPDGRIPVNVSGTL
jgi:general secretion pathway protein N